MYPSTTYLQELSNAMETYIPNHIAIRIKPKREKTIINTYSSIFDLQWKIHTIIFQLEISQLLGQNEVIVPHFISEYGELFKNLKALETEYKKLNNFNELKDIMATILPTLKTKKLSKLVYDDLVYLKENHNVSVDVKEAVTEFKNINE